MRSIGRLVQLSGLSSRRFITLFSDHTGFSPKVFARLRRFHSALQALHQDPDRGGADVALVCGYFDQSHMVREFRAFAGITPGRYVATQTSDPFHVTAH